MPSSRSLPGGGRGGGSPGSAGPGLSSPLRAAPGTLGESFSELHQPKSESRAFLNGTGGEGGNEKGEPSPRPWCVRAERGGRRWWKPADTMESVAGTALNKRCDSRRNCVSGLLTKHLQKALHLSSPVTLSQHCTGSCPNLAMSRNDALEQKMSREASSGSQSLKKAHRVLCSSLSSDGVRWYNGAVSPESLDAQMKQVYMGRPASSTSSLERVFRFCSSASSPLYKSPSSKAAGSPSKPKSSARSSLLSPLLRSHSSDPSPGSVYASKKCQPGSFHPREASDAEPAGLQEPLSFLEPMICRVTDGIYVGNLSAAYSGQVLCKNNIDSIIDLSNLPKDCNLSFIPCTCRRGPQHSWSRLKVHLQGPLQEDYFSRQPPCFWDINECIEASLEKRKRVLIHCRDGYSLAPTCVIQYLMVKHHMRLLDAYEFVRAKYPLNIQEGHRDLLVHLEKSLWPGEVDPECFKEAISRKVAWT
ncbi:hypothetical protein JRQ81_000313 [Phrynocephalus forsythii]|uniref:protein-tyrosine-phosphatase n=1 Tax=Phrynocephalus forsythii TaxID=171643 RepID=A0A9Q0Y5W8_9SAUR|nr:hypothetical protein JRQ81_000313 [Phrynocephalus forsythii]